MVKQERRAVHQSPSEILRRHRISELPVVDPAGRPVGLLDITDVIGLLPAEEAAAIGLVA